MQGSRESLKVCFLEIQSSPQRCSIIDCMRLMELVGIVRKTLNPDITNRLITYYLQPLQTQYHYNLSVCASI